MEQLAPELLHDLTSRERKLAVCAGEGTLSRADRAEILVLLSTDADEDVAQQALEALRSQPVEAFVEALKRSEVLPTVFEYASKHLVGHLAVAEAMVQNKNCPSRFITPHVPQLSSMSVQALMDSLDRVSDSSDLAAALLKSSSATADNKRVLQELLAPETPVDEKALMEALMEAEPDAGKRQTLLQRLAKMSVSERVQFAFKGGSEARRTLIRDSNKVVQRAVLQSPRLTDQEVESFAGMSSLTDEILRLIAGNRAFRKNYTIIRNLMNNSKTPLDVTLHMLPSLNAVDLKKLSNNKNVPETLRTSAAKLIRTRQTLK
jgi:replication fork clamp-binding protein CrfC